MQPDRDVYTAVVPCCATASLPLSRVTLTEICTQRLCPYYAAVPLPPSPFTIDSPQICQFAPRGPSSIAPAPQGPCGIAPVTAQAELALSVTDAKLPA